MAEKFLVVILSSALAVFLTLGIFALVKINQILAHLKSISEKAEQIADRAEAVGEFFGKAAKPLAIGKLFAGIFESMMDRKNRKNRKDDNE